jgi:3-dehydroquinate dehydratase-2
MEMRGYTDIQKFGPDRMEKHEQTILSYAKELGFELEFFTSNHEGQLIDKLYSAYKSEKYSGIIINAVGYTKGYRALATAVSQVNTKIPIVEIHFSNIHTVNLVSDVASGCTGVIVGFGVYGYKLALYAFARKSKL